MRSLIVDIGNTQIKMGVFEDKKCLTTWKMMTGARRTTDEFGLHIRSFMNFENIPVDSIDEVAISSVVPNMTHDIVSAIKRYLKKEPLLIGPGVKTGFRIKTANPSEVGADLIADVSAALERMNGPFIVLDFGTVTKFEIVNSQNEFIGAVFAPGIGISAQAMTEKAAQLPAIAIQKPKTILTSSTIDCMQAGLVYGYIGQVEYIVKKIKEELKEPNVKVIATGGFSKLLIEDLSCIDIYVPDLTLEGILTVLLKNRKKNSKAGKK